MSIITISRATFIGGKAFAENLAAKLGYRCISREELSEEAIKQNVAVGKLQTAMVKPPRVYRRLGPEKEFYLSTITSILCNQALEDNIVYHGHTGHMLFSGIPGILRIRVIGDMEYRIDTVINRLGLSREKAIDYITKVDGDRDKWVRFLYGIDWNDPSQYDLVVNLHHMDVNNVATALYEMAGMPEFRVTPATRKALKNLFLANTARSMLARDKRTKYAEFKVTADDGIVQVTCLPQQIEVAEHVQDVLKGLDDCRDVHCTIADSTILWLGERFNVESDLYQSVVKVAKKWDAAVEVMHFSSTKEEPSISTEIEIPEEMKEAADEYDGGIEEDTEDVHQKTEIVPVLDELLKEGCSGGGSPIVGRKENLLSILRRRGNYRLVVIGDIFLQKAASARTRMTEELKNFLVDNADVPVVDAAELKQSLKFGKKDYMKLAIGLTLTVVIFLAVFLNQEIIIRLLGDPSYHSWRLLVTAGIIALIPTFAFSYGSSTKKIFKLLGLD